MYVNGGTSYLNHAAFPHIVLAKLPSKRTFQPQHPILLLRHFLDMSSCTLAQFPTPRVFVPMPLLDLYRVVRDASRDKRTALKENRSHLGHRLLDVFLRTWDLGFTAFGGPPVHFKIFHNRFVLGSGGKAPWIDEQTVCDDDSSSFDAPPCSIALSSFE
jgi:hypothetical protein